MAEKRLIQEISKKSEFHSAVMTTYAFDFHHFENQVLRGLRQRAIASVNVLADTVMLDKSIGFSTGNLKSLSNYYSVHAVPCKGAFHPKITFLVGRNEVMFYQGSGNITNGGYGSNHELFTAYFANEEFQTQLPLIQEVWNYLKHLSTSVPGVGREKIVRIEQYCDLINKVAVTPHSWNEISENFKVAALYNDVSSIWSQLINLVPDNIVQEILVFAPFYDENGNTLSKLAQQFNCGIKAFLQPEKGIHPFKMEPSESIQFFSWDSTERAGFKTKNYVRKLHAKLFWFRAGNKHFCLFGSPNCTVKAFGTDQSRGANDEFALLVELSDDNWLKELGLTGDYQPIEPHSNETIQQAEQQLEEDEQSQVRKVRLLGVDIDERDVIAYVSNKTNRLSATLCLANQWGEVLEQFKLNLTKGKINLHVSEENKNALAYAFLLDEKENLVSNKQVINSYFDRYNSDPSKENRILVRLSHELEMGKNKPFAVVDYFNAIGTNRTDRVTTVSDVNRKNEPNPVDEKQPAASITYEESLMLEEANETHRKILRQHHAIKLFDAIAQRFRELAREEEEEDIDDEEDIESATKGRERKEKPNLSAPIHLNSTKVISNRRARITRFLKNYSKMLDKAIAKDNHTFGHVDIAMFMIMLYELLGFADREVVLKVPDKKGAVSGHVLFPIEGNYGELTSLNGALLNLVGKFITLVSLKKPTQYKDNYSKKKFAQYSINCHRTTLFTLAAMRSKYSAEDAIANWYDTLGYNVLLIFGALHEEYESKLRSFQKQICLTHFSYEKTFEVLTNWLAEIERIDEMDDYYIHPSLGLCAITKHIPSKEETKFIRLARPGIPYDANENEFCFPDLWDVNQLKFMPSKQRYKDGKKVS